MTSLYKAIGFSRDLKTKDRFAYIIAGFSIGILASFLIVYITLIKSRPLILSTLLCFVLVLAGVLLLKLNFFYTAKIVLISAIVIQETLLVYLWFPPDTNVKYFFFVIVPISFLIFDGGKRVEQRTTLFFSVLTTVLIVLNEFFPLPRPGIETTPSLNRLMSVMSVMSTIGAMAAVFYLYEGSISRQHKKLDLLAQTDGLTGIYNRRALFAMGESLFNRPQEEENGFALLIFDLDHFKAINDTFGHRAGDKVLQELTACLSDNIREKDFLSRYGGEEFALILHDIAPDAAAVVAEDLRTKVEELTVLWDRKPIRITTSIGLAHTKFRPTNFDDFLKNADAALYRAKEKGRNRIEVSFSAS